MKVFIGVDVGATKTQTLAVNAAGDVLGMVTKGPGATWIVGYDGFGALVDASIQEVLQLAGATKADIVAAGYGVSGYDCPHDLSPIVEALNRLGLGGAMSVHNDGDLPLAAGTSESWGVAVSAGTSNIVSGMNRQGGYARSTGGSVHGGELGGAVELVYIAIQAVAYEYTRRGPATQITPLMIAETGSKNIPDLLSRVLPGQIQVAPSFAMQIIGAAVEGDAVAADLLAQSGRDLGLTTVGIMRQVGIQTEPCEVVLSGSMFKQMVPYFVNPLKEAILAEAPRAQFVKLETLPVVGGVILAMKKVGYDFGPYRAKIMRQVNALSMG
jgi:N-acetylglucosamine kinase-like BadF-type ATPase